MSSRQRKRPGGAIDSRPARKRSRLLPSSAGGTSQTEPRDLEESATPAFEPEVIDLTGEDTIDLTGEDVIELRVEDVIDLTGEDVIDLTGEEEVIDLTGEDTVDLQGEEVIDLTGEDVVDLTGESSEPEVIIISDDESPMDREQSQQQLHLSRASAEPLARDDEEEPRDIDGSALSSDWLLFDFDLPYWSDEDSEVRIHMSLSFLVFGRERDKRGAAQLSCFRWVPRAAGWKHSPCWEAPTCPFLQVPSCWCPQREKPLPGWHWQICLFLTVLALSDRLHIAQVPFSWCR
ncbi:uncharacterized protein LOC128787408 [Vidua chalybeata]|uniref:uncharacterized protein LOC128787408 n=1 Tax=Vidua chalybeata TaxID=81927 RepID=UPI0023A79CA9|nr:uncharacterized protein LOC128787408 [Vidua chalybeata]